MIKSSTKLKLILIFSILAAGTVSSTLLYGVAIKLLFEKEDVLIIDGTGNRITGQTMRIPAPKARDFIFWNTSAGIKSINPKVKAVKLYLNFTLREVTAAKIYGFDDDQIALWIRVYLVARNKTIVAGLEPFFNANVSSLVGVLTRKEISEGNRTICITTPVIPINADEIYWLFLSIENLQPLSKDVHIEVNMALGIEYGL